MEPKEPYTDSCFAKGFQLGCWVRVGWGSVMLPILVFMQFCL